MDINQPHHPPSYGLLKELKELLPLSPALLPEPSLDVSLIIPAKNAAQTLNHTVKEAHDFLQKRYPGSFEIILVPNPTPKHENHDHEDHSPRVAEDLARIYPNVRVCPHYSPVGKGAAIRTGFSQARGRWIFFTDADLPYDLNFFDEAATRLSSGIDLITGNRRLPQSHFLIPVSLLSLAYGRHRLGLWFNQLVRWILPLTTIDTQAGIKALSRKLAVEVFTRQRCPGFLFDLEIFLTASAFRYSHAELPVTLHLNSEKSTIRILRECFLVAHWLRRIRKNYRLGHYGGRADPGRKVLSRFRQAPVSTRFFLGARWYLTPYNRIVSYLPWSGRILDLGCGHGLLALVAAITSPARQVVAVDHDQSRVLLGQRAIKDLKNIRFETSSLLQVGSELPVGSPVGAMEPFSGITLIDVLHYFDPPSQERILKQAHQMLAKGGTLLVREVDPNAGPTSHWNRFYERVATSTGFTQAEQKNLHFRSRQGWEDLMEKMGYKVRSERCSSLLFADILYICERAQ